MRVSCRVKRRKAIEMKCSAPAEVGARSIAISADSFQKTSRNKVRPHPDCAGRSYLLRGLGWCGRRSPRTISLRNMKTTRGAPYPHRKFPSWIVANGEPTGRIARQRQRVSRELASIPERVKPGFEPIKKWPGVKPKFSSEKERYAAHPAPSNRSGTMPLEREDRGDIDNSS